jgi:hypothetical protein
MSESFDSLTRHAKVLLRAERLIGEIRLKRVLRQTGLVAFAGLIAVFGLAMLNVAAYFALKPYWGDALAMLAVGVADLVIAGILVAIASAGGNDQQLELAGELRDHAIAGIEVEAKAAAGRITGTLSLAGGAASLLATVLSGFLRGRRKS